MVKVAHKDAEILGMIFQRYGEVKGYPWLGYAVSRNMAALTPVIEAIQAARSLSEREQELESARQKLLIEHAQRDERGNPVSYPVMVPGGGQNVRYEVEDKTAYNAALEAMIASDFSDVEAIAEDREKEFKRVWESDAELDLQVIKYSDAPEDLISGNDMTMLFKYNILEWDLERPAAASDASDSETSDTAEKATA